MFLCFFSAIFQLTRAKFQTFACNSRTVRSSFMKFWQQFEIIELYVYIKFRGNRSRDFDFRTRKPPRKFGVKSGLSQKRLMFVKKYITRLYVLRYPFIPTNPLSDAMSFFSFFLVFFSFFFLFLFFLNFVRSSFPKPQTSKSNFCVKLLSYKRKFFLPKFFGAIPPGTPPKWDPKNQFFFGSS